MTRFRFTRLQALLFMMLLLGSIDIWFYFADAWVNGTPADYVSHLVKIVSILLLVMLGFTASRLQVSLESQRKIATNLQQERFAIDQHAIVSFTDVTGNITYANDRFCEISGYRREELLGQNHRILKSGQHPDEFYRDMWQTVASGKVWQGEVCNRAKDGRLYWVSSTVVPYLDEQGQPWQYASIRTDITARKDAEMRVEENRQFLLGITDAMGEGVYALDIQGRTTFINKEAERLLGWTQEELLGQNLHDITHSQRPDGSHLPFEECPVRLAMARGESFRSSDELFITKQGERIPVAMVAAPLFSQGKAVGSVAVFRDIREQIRHRQELEQARDQALEASRLKSEFLSTMSHEIRTPMNGVIGMTDLLLDTPLDSQQREFASTILDSAHALLEIINDILDFSKIEAGKLEVEKIEFQLLPVFEGSMELLAGKAREKNLQLLSHLDPAIPPSLIGDPGRLRQILLNLISNAVKFTATGRIVLRALALPGDVHGRRVRFEVRDTGIGMSREIADKLFRPFTQADGSVTRKYGGTGLGLSICKRLVELMEGSIGVDSNDGQGSIFWFELPLEPGKDQRPPIDIPPRLTDSEILLICPDPEQSDMLSETLKAWQFGVSGCDSLDTALADLQRGNRYRIAVCADIREQHRPRLPEALLAAQPELRLLLLTHDKTALEQAAAQGFHGALLQPVRQGNLVEGLLQVIDRRTRNLPVTQERRTEPAKKPNLMRHSDPNRLILLVEDNTVNQKVAINMIDKLGYAAHVAADGLQALEILACRPYALVLMDCQMPVMDGFETTRQIRKSEAGSGKRIPIIAMTANAMQGDRERCLEAGMDDYLSKPIDPAALKSLLTQWLGQLEGSSGGAPVEPVAPVVDMARLHDMFGDDTDSILELLDVFIGTTRPMLDKLRFAIELKSWADIKAQAHQIAGSAGNLGIAELHDLGRAMERASADQDVGQAGSLHASMLKAFQALADYVNNGLK